MFSMTLEESARSVRGRLHTRRTGVFASGVAQGVSTDSRTLEPENLFVALEGPNYDGHDFLEEAFSKGASAALVRCAPENPDEHAYIVVSDTLRALGDLAAAWRDRLAGRVVALTGTAGKTSTREMLVQILRGSGTVTSPRSSYNNFIGVPLTLLSASPNDAYVVIEIGTNAPGEIDRLARIVRPEVGLITTIGPGHLAGLGSPEGVAREKADLLTHSRSVVLPHECPYLNLFLKWSGERPMITYGYSESASVRGEILEEEPLRGSIFRVNGQGHYRLPIPGRHAVSNALAATAVAWRLGIPPDQGCVRLEHLTAPAHRMSVRTEHGFTLIDDCYNANPLSFEAALNVLAAASGRRICVTGDMLELGTMSGDFHRRLGVRIAHSGVTRLFSIGVFAPLVAQGAIEGGLPKRAIRTFKRAEDLADVIRRAVRPTDTILIKGSRAVHLEVVVDALTRLKAVPSRVCRQAG